MKSPVNSKAEREEILCHIEKLETAENQKDIEGMLELVTRDFVFVYRDCKIEGKQDAGEMLKESAKNYLSSRHIPLRVEVSSSGDMAWLLGYELNKRERDEGVVETKQYYMIAFRKVEGGWKEVAVCIA